MAKKYNLDMPAHELAVEISGDLYEQAKSGVVDYGERPVIAELIWQFQLKLHAERKLIEQLRAALDDSTFYLRVMNGDEEMPPTADEWHLKEQIIANEDLLASGS